MRPTYVSGSVRRPGKDNENIFLPSISVLWESDDESLYFDIGARRQLIHAVSLRFIDTLSLILWMHVDKTPGGDGVARVYPVFAMSKSRRKFFQNFFLAEGDSPEFSWSHHPVVIELTPGFRPLRKGRLQRLSSVCIHLDS